MSKFEIPTQIPIETRIVNKLTGLFTGGKESKPIKWRNELQIGPFGDTFHSPLAQLWYLYKYGGGITLSNIEKSQSKYSGEIIKTPFPDSLTPNVAVVETEGAASDILDLISTNEAAVSSGVSEKIKTKIATANRIMLAGCISIYTAVSLIDRLQKYGFKSQIDIYDLSAGPLEIIKQYYESDYWKEITVNTRQKDLFDISLGVEKVFNPDNEDESNYDLIFADVIGHYLTDEQMYYMTELWYALNDKGLILLRDLAESEEVPNKKMTLHKKGENFEESEKKFIIWLQNTFGYEITLEEVQKMRSNMFNNPTKHEYRQLYLADWIYYIFSGHGPEMQLLYRGFTSSSTGDDSRIFPIFVFEKERELKYLFLDNPDKSSFALRV